MGRRGAGPLGGQHESDGGGGGDDDGGNVVLAAGAPSPPRLSSPSSQGSDAAGRRRQLRWGLFGGGFGGTGGTNSSSSGHSPGPVLSTRSVLVLATSVAVFLSIGASLRSSRYVSGAYKDLAAAVPSSSGDDVGGVDHQHLHHRRGRQQQGSQQEQQQLQQQQRGQNEQHPEQPPGGGQQQRSPPPPPLSERGRAEQNANGGIGNNRTTYSHHGHPGHRPGVNIVLFYADDWTYRTLGSINPHVRTPNIDLLARDGVTFARNCVTSSICWQSRATMVTGQYVSVHRQHLISSTSIFNETVNWSTQTLYPLLRRVGEYEVGYVGKWHAPMDDDFRNEAFDSFVSYYGEHWMERDGELRHVTDLNGEDALKFLRKVRRRGRKNNNKKKKFALTVSFFATHSWDDKTYPDQYMPQPRTGRLYPPNVTIPEPRTATKGHYKALPKFLRGDNEARNRWRERYNTAERYQVTMKRIYRMASEVDDVVGDVVRELKDQGAYDDTLIVFTTDNGVFHGEHQLAGKWYPHEESIRVPLIIQDPRMSDEVRGTTNGEFTLNIDLAPTLLSAAGVPVPTSMQGRDIADLYLSEDLAAAAKSWRKDFFYEWTQGNPVDGEGSVQAGWIPSVFALIRKDYKYFYWPEAKREQLFRIETDIFEESDIWKSTKQTEPHKILELQSRYAFLKYRSQTGHPA